MSFSLPSEYQRSLILTVVTVLSLEIYEALKPAFQKDI